MCKSLSKNRLNSKYLEFYHTFCIVQLQFQSKKVICQTLLCLICTHAIIQRKRPVTNCCLVFHAFFLLYISLLRGLSLKFTYCAIGEKQLISDINISLQHIQYYKPCRDFRQPYWSASSDSANDDIQINDIVINTGKHIVTLIPVHCPLRLMYPNRLPLVSFPLM